MKYSTLCCRLSLLLHILTSYFNTIWIGVWLGPMEPAMEPLMCLQIGFLIKYELHLFFLFHKLLSRVKNIILRESSFLYHSRVGIESNLQCLVGNEDFISSKNEGNASYHRHAARRNPILEIQSSSTEREKKAEVDGLVKRRWSSCISSLNGVGQFH